MRRSGGLQIGEGDEERPLLRAIELEPPGPDEVVYERGNKRDGKHELEQIENTTIL